jgi:PAS domain S-box-containing protein
MMENANIVLEQMMLPMLATRQELGSASLNGGSEAKFQQLLDTLPAGAYLCNREGLITYYNPRAVELWGRTPKLNDPEDRFCGSFRLYAADGTSLHHNQCWMALALRDEAAYNGEEIIVERPDGQRLTVLAHANPIRDEAGTLLGAVNVLVDISDRKQNETSLRRSHDELEQRVAERTAELKANEETAQQQASHAQALVRAAAVLNAQLDLDTVLARVGQVMADALRVSVILVYLYDEVTKQFTFASSQGLPDELRPLLRPLPLPLYERYSRELGPVKRFLDLTGTSEWLDPQLVEPLHLKRATIVDMGREEKVIGCIIILKQEHERWLTAEELGLLKALADHAAQAVTNARLHQEVQEREERLHRLSQRLLTAEEEERERLSRELHDSTGQVATALLINLSLLRQALPAGSEVLLAHIEEANELARRIYEEVRSIAHGLRPPELEKIGLDVAISELCQEFSKFARQPVQYERVTIPPIPDTVELTFYRFVQEALNNAAKYARANRIAVTLQCTDGLLQATVEDDGIGFTQSENMNVLGGGIGLVSMRERLQMLGGRLDINSSPGHGARLVASYPMNGMQSAPAEVNGAGVVEKGYQSFA